MPKGSKGVLGWLKITVKDAEKHGRAVKYTPKEDNIYHADIMLPEGEETEVAHNMELWAASMERWEPAPQGQLVEVKDAPSTT